MPTSAAIFEKVLRTEEKKNNKKTNSSFSLLKEETKKNHPERMRKTEEEKKTRERPGLLENKKRFLDFVFSLSLIYIECWCTELHKARRKQGASAGNEKNGRRRQQRERRKRGREKPESLLLSLSLEVLFSCLSLSLFKGISPLQSPREPLQVVVDCVPRPDAGGLSKERGGVELSGVEEEEVRKAKRSRWRSREKKRKKKGQSENIDIKNKPTAAATHASSALLWPAHATSTSYLLPCEMRIQREWVKKRRGKGERGR